MLYTVRSRSKRRTPEEWTTIWMFDDEAYTPVDYVAAMSYTYYIIVM